MAYTLTRQDLKAPNKVILKETYPCKPGFTGRSVVKNPPTKAGASGSIPGLERAPGKGSGNPLQYSGLGNPMDRRAWRATVCGVAKSQT